MTMLKEAERLHKAGYDLIPLEGKRPAVAGNWVAAPRLDISELLTKLKQGANLGVRLGHELEDGRYIACIDVDVVTDLTTAEKKQLDEVLKTAIGSATPPMSVTGFGHGSKHLYVATSEPAKTRKLGEADRKVTYTKSGAQKRGPAWTVELRGRGAQVVLPPSTHPDTREKYQWKRRLNGAERIPELLATAPAPKQPARSTTWDGDVETLPIAPLYRRMLTSGDAADYESRSEALYAVLQVLIRDTDLTDTAIESLLRSQPLGEKARERPQGWVVAQCQKIRANRPLGEQGVISELRKLPEGATASQLKPLFERAAKSGLSAIERAEFLSIAKERSGLPKEALSSELDSYKGDAGAQQARLAHGDPVYEEVLGRHALVSWAGKPAVFRSRQDPPSWESRYDIMTLGSLATFYENKPVFVGKKAVNPIDLWRADTDRQEFLEGARLIPPDEKVPEGVFNLWQGFATRPVKGSVGPWREFLLSVICAGHKGYLEWLEDWIADMFQNVSHPKGVAVVLRGEEGIGKGTFANVLGHIMGSHYRHVTQESQLTGRFNGHFADSALIFADELVWGGDKKHRGTLYALVTEKYLMVERKNFDAVPMRNLNRMIIASNNDWVVPTGMDGRRWFVLDVANQRKGDTVYFEHIRKFLKNGYAAILDYYLKRQISHDLRIAPVTNALIDQKIAGFDSVASWWTAVLERGCLKPPVGDACSEWEGRVSKELLKISYHAFCGDYGVKPYFHGIMMKSLHKLVPGIKEVRGRDKDKRIQMVELPPLEACQEFMQRKLNGMLPQAEV